MPLPDACPICGAPPSLRQRKAPRFIIPDGFYRQQTKTTARPAGLYVQRVAQSDEIGIVAFQRYRV